MLEYVFGGVCFEITVAMLYIRVTMTVHLECLLSFKSTSYVRRSPTDVLIIPKPDMILLSLIAFTSPSSEESQVPIYWCW